MGCKLDHSGHVGGRSNGSDGEAHLILLLNGAFGVGKTSVARALVSRLPRSVLVNPEGIGVVLQRVSRAMSREVSDFQDVRLWRRLTVAALRAARLFFPNVVVPMAFSNADYLHEIRTAVRRFEPHVHTVCLVAPLEVVHDRLRERRMRPAEKAWVHRRAAECCAVHSDARFGRQVSADQPIGDVSREILAVIEENATTKTQRRTEDS